MGLFSSSYETTVGTVVSRVIPDETLPNSVVKGGLRALIKSSDIYETIFEEMSNSVAMKAERMYEYAKTSYVHGLPSGQFTSAMEGRDEVTAVLTGIDGEDVVLVYSHHQPPNMQHMAWMQLVSLHGYNPTTNEFPGLSTSVGYDVYLEDMVLVIPADDFDKLNPSSLEQWGLPATSGYAPSRKTTVAMGDFRKPTPPERNNEATSIYARVTYCWEEPRHDTIAEGFEDGLVVHRDTLVIPITGLDDTADYFQVKYLDGSSVKYWMYKSGTGTYPTLDGVFNTPAEPNGTFFPFVYFRYNKTSEISDKNTDSYKTGKKVLKYLGMDFDTVAEAIDENPDIDDVEQAMLVMAVPASTSDPLELRYLFSFFSNLFASNENQYSSPISLRIAQNQIKSRYEEIDITRSSIVIQDSRFKMALSNGGITKRRVGGSIGAIGTHTMVLENLLVESEYYDYGTGVNATQTVPFKVHVYRKQVSTAIYEEVRVVNLKMLYHIYEEYKTTGDEDDDILLVPLDRSITEDYSIPDREILYSRSMHYVFNSRIVTEVKWYQSDLFQFLMMVVAVVITVASMGSSVELLAAAISSGSSAAISAAVLALLTEVFITLGIGQVLKLVVKALGLELSVLIAVLAVLSGHFELIPGSGGLSGAPWADQLLQLATGLIQAATDVLKDMFNGLAAEFDALNLLQDETSKELAEANKLLENNNWLSPIVIFGETPNDFYNRTTHSGNIGILSIGAISSYVDIALTLPKLNETIKDSLYDY